jgi:integrase
MSKIHQIPFDKWPVADQEAWNTLFVEGDILDGDGPASHWAPATRKGNQKHYAQWLGWLSHAGLLHPLTQGKAPWTRATLQTIHAYGKALRDGRSARTVASSLIGLKCVLIRMAPDRDWRWLRDITNRLDAWAEVNTPKKDTFPITAPEIYSRCLIVLDGLMAAPLTRPTDRNKFRDTLIIALLTACPIRLRNLTMIEIGWHLIESDTEWRLVFKSNETKTGEPLNYIIPNELVPHLSHYLNHIRRSYRGSEGTRRLWMGLKKAPLSYEAIYGAVTARSKALFGTRLSPHDFRSLAATFLSETSTSDALHARSLLGHSSPETTERHYTRANSISASRRTADILREIRDG